MQVHWSSYSWASTLTLLSWPNPKAPVRTLLPGLPTLSVLLVIWCLNQPSLDATDSLRKAVLGFSVTTSGLRISFLGHVLMEGGANGVAHSDVFPSSSTFIVFSLPLNSAPRVPPFYSSTWSVPSASLPPTSDDAVEGRAPLTWDPGAASNNQCHLTRTSISWPVCFTRNHFFRVYVHFSTDTDVGKDIGVSWNIYLLYKWLPSSSMDKCIWGPLS
jgi:hypothetical protein